MTDTPVDAAAAQELAEAVAEAMWSRDRAAQALGMRIDSVAPGRASLSMPVRSDMVNGHHICHGGLIFALADTAFAYACNAYNLNTVGSGCSIDYVAPGKEGDTLQAIAVERSMTSSCVMAQAGTLPCSAARATALPVKSSPAWLPASADRQVEKNREERGQSHAREKPPSR